MKCFIIVLIFTAKFTFAEVPTTASPQETLKEFQQACVKQDLRKAHTLIAKFPDLPHQVVAFTDEKVTKLIVRIASSDIVFNTLGEKIEGDYAVVMIKDEGPDKTNDYDPIFFIRQEREWRIFPKFSGWKIDKNILKNEEVLERLKKWFEEETLKRKVGPVK